MEETLYNLEKYDRVEIVMDDMKSAIYKGQFRGRIKDADHCYFDKDGSAIWVTADQGFELMLSIDDIYSLVVTEKYNH